MLASHEPLRGKFAMGTNGQAGRNARATLTRREMLKAGGCGLASLGLGLGGPSARANVSAASERSAILLLLVGGPSQLETWDPKPDALRR